MSQPQRWWIGLLLLIPLWIFANWIETPNVEADLSARAGRASATASKMITGGAATAQGRDITLSGRALSGDAPEAARQAALGERGVRLVNSGIAPADAPKPYPFTASLANGALTLAGYAPSPDVRAKVLAAARAIPGAKVTDNMQLGAGAPAGFESMAGHGLAQLGKLGNGQFSLSDVTWSLTGQAPNNAVFGDVTAAAGALPLGAQRGRIAITAPLAKPYAFNVGRNGDAVTMAGVVPSVAARGEIAAAITKALPTAKIADTTALASGEPAGFAAIAGHGAGLAARLIDGKFSLSDATYSLSGRAPTASSFDELTKLAGALPQGATRGQIAITAPLAKPYAFNVGRNGDAVTMAGVVPSVAVRGEIAAAITKALPTAKIADSTALASGEPSGFAAMASHGAGLAARLIDGKFSLSDATYSLSGRAPAAAAHGELTKLAGALPQGATRGQIEIGLPVAGRYLLEAVRTPAGMTVSGNVPSVEVRDAILAVARKAIAPGLVTDATTLAAGAPQGFAAIASHGAALAGQLIDGKFSLEGNSYSLSGRAPSTGAYAGLLAASQALPAGAQASAVSVLPAIANPYAFSARQGNDRRVVLSGFVPGQGQRAALVAAAQKWFPDAVDDRLEIAAGEPGGFEGVAAAGIGMMARLQNGAWSLANGKWSLSGDAPSQDTANGVLAALRKSLGAAIDFDGSGVKAPPPPPPPPVVAPPPPPPAPAPVVQAPVAPPPVPKPVAPPADPCARGADGIIARAVIRFDTADRNLTPDDSAALEKLIGVLNACASAKLEIEGHTDNQGARERNIPLSSRRAFSTSRYFTSAGVSRERITTRGYGEDRPLADNATPEGRAQNRRVEVLVK